MPSVTVVIPAYNAARTIGAVLRALAEQQHRPDEVIVVDDGSTDETARIASGLGARVIRSSGGHAGGARNAGWEAARSDVVCFLDSDAVPLPGWAEGLARALEEFPGAIVGCARTFAASTTWGWVAHLQVETPYLPRGEPRDVSFVSSYCMAVPRAAPLRFDLSYGGEDGVFCAQALAHGMRIVFDPRFQARHDHDRESFPGLRRQQRRHAYGMARIGPIQREGRRKRVLARVPIHYFALARLLPIGLRLRSSPDLFGRYVRLLPRLAIAEWTLGASALRYAIRRPSLHGQDGAGFR